ncbi:hypothetical protein F4819DRAFT_442407 [Hypoxylon fuscum]|nr:hypothetical protein F4819DRAFT_442407 [Hypoxylon fuscum]
MALPTAETQAKVASEAAQTFIDHYYETLSRPPPRRTLAPFYASASPRLVAAGVGVPDISINGRVCGSAGEYEALLEAQGARVTYDVRSFDAQPVHPSFGAGQPSGPGETTAASPDKGDCVSVALQVSGVVRYGRGHTSRDDGGAAATTTTTTAAATNTNTTTAAPVVNGGASFFGGGGGEKKDADSGPAEKAFNEAFLLVPHWEAWAPNAPRGLRRWVIASQNFRAL